nr:hypothetical protein [uncultured Carboxylicivirga sp.]
MMKNLTIALFVFLSLMACNKENENPALEKSPYATACPVDYVFITENGNSLIDLDQSETFPAIFSIDPSEIDRQEVLEYQNKFYYNGNANEVWYNANLDKNMWSTIVYGMVPKTEAESFIGFNNFDTDSITTVTSYSDECIGAQYCVTIHEVYYNQTLIYSDGTLSDKLTPDYVTIVKSKTQTQVQIPNE